jgi:hypothetical protein
VFTKRHDWSKSSALSEIGSHGLEYGRLYETVTKIDHDYHFYDNDKPPSLTIYLSDQASTWQASTWA